MPTGLKRREVNDDDGISAPQQITLSANSIREMALSPPVAEIYLYGQAAMTHASLTLPERHAVQLAISAYNACHYCTATCVTAGRAAGITSDDLSAISYGELPASDRLRILITATRLILEKHGWLDDDDEAMLAERGVDREQLYEIVALIGLTLISNYVNHIAHTRLDSHVTG